MLKVNTKKISIEEFAKKYGFSNKEITHTDYYDSHWFKIPTDFPNILLINENGNILIDGKPNNKNLSLLFDMISSSDVIKEEEK